MVHESPSPRKLLDLEKINDLYEDYTEHGEDTDDDERYLKFAYSIYNNWPNLYSFIGMLQASEKEGWRYVDELQEEIKEQLKSNNDYQKLILKMVDQLNLTDEGQKLLGELIELKRLEEERRIAHNFRAKEHSEYGR